MFFDEVVACCTCSTVGCYYRMKRLTFLEVGLRNPVPDRCTGTHQRRSLYHGHESGVPEDTDSGMCWGLLEISEVPHSRAKPGACIIGS